MLPFEFVVARTPRSYQTSNRARLRLWRDEVRAAALERWPAGQPPLAGSLRITVVYFHEGTAVRLDTDNLIKPIQDALNGLVYGDDRQITDMVVRKTILDAPVRPRGMSAVLAEGFRHSVAFIYVKIDEAPDHTELL